jgi:hypothetical protein
MLATAGIITVIFPQMSAHADIWGADVGVLTQILAENIKQYYQLEEMVQQGHDASDYLRMINAGIDNSIGLLQSLPIKDEKILAELRDFKKSTDKVQSLYGLVPKSPEQSMQTLHDDTVAESFRMATSFKEFSDTEEKNSEVIAIEARDASPKGAARMQAETSAQILKSLAQLIRLDTQILKMQSEQLAMNNKASKDQVSNFQKVNDDLGSGFLNFKPDMKLERF